MAELEGRLAVVTGGAAGIGRATCLALASRGARVAIGDVDVANAIAVVEAITARGGEAAAFHVDVRDQASVDAFISAATERFGQVDIVVPNAGVASRAFVHELEEEEFRRMLDINLLGVFRTCRAALPGLYERRAGTIVIVASDAGKRGEGGAAGYTATKFGVLGLMESLAEEARTYGVRVNAVCPSGVKTALSLSLERADGTRYDSTSWMEPEEVAEVIAFLASDRSRALTGTSVDIPGGVRP
ncbi:MAG: SDR family NAD(P)-dependent oxidoreductase [Chloroflexota bacterium]